MIEITPDMVFVKEYDKVILYEDKFTRELYRDMCKPDINGIDLSMYHIYKFVSKVEDSYMYVMVNPEGNPFHDESTYEGWYSFFNMLRLSLKCDTDIVDMAEKRMGKKHKRGFRR